MLRTRVMPCLLLDDGALVKSIQFGNLQYVGDPINAVRIFNELEVDELILLDIGASSAGVEPDYALVRHIADECFMPLSYGGGVRGLGEARRLFEIGVEKVAMNTSALIDPGNVTSVTSQFGSQSVIASIDARKLRLGGHRVFAERGTRNTKSTPATVATRLVEAGAGEVLLTSIDRDGTWSGFDLDLVAGVTSAVEVPVVASGGAGRIEHMVQAVTLAGAAAVAIGSMAVFQKQGSGVLVNFPDRARLDAALP